MACTDYHKLAFWGTKYSMIALPGTDVLKSLTLLASESTFHAQYGLIFVLMTLESNMLVMIICKIYLQPFKLRPTLLLKIGLVTYTVMILTLIGTMLNAG